MNWMDPIRKAGKVLVGTSLVLSLGPASSVLGANPCYQCPPGYRQNGPSPYYSAPGQPGMTAPQTPTPADRSGQGPGMGMDQTQPQAQAQDQNQQQQPSDFTPSPDNSGRASLAPGMNTPQLGRLDQANRLNLFDNMVAQPINKVWFGLQYSSGITTGIQPYDSSLLTSSLISSDPLLNGTHGNIFGSQKQINYRAGAEVLVNQDMSIAFQAQYFTNETSGSAFGDDWSNPQFLAKYVLARDCDTILSATLGLTTQTPVQFGDFNENTTKIYPGLLYYETLNRDWFTQGGFQFGIPFRDDQITTFDWSASLGYWLYRDCSYGRCCCCNQGTITGIIPQIGLLGKHVIGDPTRFNAFGIPSSGSLFGGPPLIIYHEPNDVIDLTAGTLITVGCDWQIGLGYSFPITSQSTRDSEFLSYVNYLF